MKLLSQILLQIVFFTLTLLFLLSDITSSQCHKAVAKKGKIKQNYKFKNIDAGLSKIAGCQQLSPSIPDLGKIFSSAGLLVCFFKNRAKTYSCLL